MFLLFRYKGNEEGLRRSYIHHVDGIESLLYYPGLPSVYVRQEA